jgi:hypothetical protein
LRPSKGVRAAGTGASVPIESCQICGHAPLDAVLSLGYMPPVNQMVKIGEVPRRQPWFPTTLLRSSASPAIIFPPDFADLQRESAGMLGLGADELIVDIGSNDGTLLSNFKNAGIRVLGIEPTDVGDIANQRGIPKLKRYFGVEVARDQARKHGPATLVTPPIVSPISRTCT